MHREFMKTFIVKILLLATFLSHQACALKKQESSTEKAAPPCEALKNKSQHDFCESATSNLSSYSANQIQKSLGVSTLCSFRSDKNESPYVELFSISAEKKLLLVACEEGAYQHSYLGYLVDTAKPLADAIPLTWERPEYDDTWALEKSSSIIGNFSFDEKTQTLQVVDRSNGAGTCGSISSYHLSAISGKHIQLAGAKGEGDCFAGITLDEWSDISFKKTPH